MRKSNSLESAVEQVEHEYRPAIERPAAVTELTLLLMELSGQLVRFEKCIEKVARGRRISPALRAKRKSVRMQKNGNSSMIEQGEPHHGLSMHDRRVGELDVPGAGKIRTPCGDVPVVKTDNGTSATSKLLPFLKSMCEQLIDSVHNLLL